MTNQSDKLPALAGIVSRHQTGNDSGFYLNGLFSKHLPSALLWNVNLDSYSKPSNIRQQVYRAPTWSCASVNGSVSYKSQRMRSTDEETRMTSSNYEFQI